jgi:hypothetical protein
MNPSKIRSNSKKNRTAAEATDRYHPSSFRPAFNLAIQATYEDVDAAAILLKQAQACWMQGITLSPEEFWDILTELSQIGGPRNALGGGEGPRRLASRVLRNPNGSATRSDHENKTRR